MRASADPIVIELAGPPVAKGRPRFTSRGEGRSVAYTPSKTRHYETALQYAASQVMGAQQLLIGPVSLSVVARVPIPSSWSLKKQEQARRGEIQPTKRPDADNFLKIAQDALSAVVFADDAQICFAMVSKVYSDKPGLRIEVAPITQTASEAA